MLRPAEAVTALTKTKSSGRRKGLCFPTNLVVPAVSSIESGFAACLYKQRVRIGYGVAILSPNIAAAARNTGVDSASAKVAADGHIMKITWERPRRNRIDMSKVVVPLLKTP